MVVTHARTGKPFATKYAHSVFGQDRETVEEAFPGDVVGLVNATDLRVGDTLWGTKPVSSPDPELRPRALLGRPGPTTAASSSSARGIAQLDEEGVVQVLRDPDLGDQAPVLAAVGPMQFDVAKWHRLETRVRRSGRARAPRRTGGPSAPTPTRRCRCDRCLG
jgi:peptide chain release factor 3